MIGRPIEEIIPNSLMRKVAETEEPILLDIMELGGEQLVVTRRMLRISRATLYKKLSKAGLTPSGSARFTLS